MVQHKISKDLTKSVNFINVLNVTFVSKTDLFSYILTVKILEINQALTPNWYETALAGPWMRNVAPSHTYSLYLPVITVLKSF